jgi:aminopeptidase N
MKFEKLLNILLLIILPTFILGQTIEDNNYYDASYKLENDSIESEGNEYIDVYSYYINNFQLLPKEQLLRATTRITLSSSKNLNSFYLDFHNSFKIQSLKVNDTVAEWEFKHDHNLYIKPQKGIKKNTQFVVEVKYYNTSEDTELWKKAIFEDNFIFTDLPNYLLFPSNEVLSDRAFYKLKITIPNNYKLVSFGDKVNKENNNYTIETKSTLSINNFTLNLLNDYSTFSIDGPKLSFGALTPKVSINQYTPLDSTILFTDIIERVPQQMAFLDSILGYYPYRNFNIIITKNIINKGVFSKRSTIILPYAYTIDSTEVNHKILNGLVKQWFGNKVGVKNEKDFWITEGISKYVEWLLIEQQVGKMKFNMMMNSKLVEARKYIGKIDWHQMNPYPLYTFDLKNVVQDFGNLSKTKIMKGDKISFLYKVINLDPKTVSDSIRDSFMERFGHSIDERCEKGHSYYELMNWAKDQKRGSFSISSDGFYTLKSMQEQEFKTHPFKLADPGKEFKHNFTIAIRGALFIHALRLYFGDDVFFKKTLYFASHNAEKSLSTEYLVDKLNKETNGEIKDYINLWLYSDTKIPSYIPRRKVETTE